jgi:rod shape determining protein RodA
MIRGFDRRLIEHFDWPIFWLTVIISLIGLANLYSATFNLPSDKYFINQCYWLLLGFTFCALIVLFDYRFLERIAYPLYIVMLLLLIFVLIKGRFVSGSKRWIDLGIFSFQPSEMAKLVMIFTLSKFFHNREKTSSMGFFEFLKPLFIIALPTVLILLEPDLGTSIVLLLISFTVICLAGIRWKTVLILAVAVAIVLPLGWNFLIKDYQKRRIRGFLNPEADPLGSGYQQIQSKIAVGSGILFGKGYLKGTQSKLQFLPKQHTDFIMSNYSEEWGFFGSMVLLLLFSVLLIRGLSVAYNAKEKFGALMSYGLCALFFWQIFINISMELGIMPVVGMTLPLMSYGGSSLITNLVAVGLLLNVSMRRYLF